MTEASPIAGDMSRECFCTCHIPIAKISTNPAFGVWIRIECTQHSFAIDVSGLLCGACGRSGKERYGHIDDATAVRLGTEAHRRWNNPNSSANVPSLDSMGKALTIFRAALDDHFKSLEQREEQRQKAVAELEKHLEFLKSFIPVMEALFDLWINDGHVGADFENWIRLASFFNMEEEARELADSYDPEGGWVTRTIFGRDRATP